MVLQVVKTDGCMCIVLEINIYCLLIKKNQLDALISQIYFWNKTLHVSDSSCVHHQEFFTVHTAVVYAIEVASRVRTEFRPDPARKLSTNLYDIYHCCVYSGENSR